MTTSKTLSAETDPSKMLGGPSAGDQRLISQLVTALVQSIGADRYELYFEEQTFQITNGVLGVSAETEFSLTQIRNRFGTILQQTIARLWGADIRLEFQVREARIQAKLFADDTSESNGGPAVVTKKVRGSSPRSDRKFREPELRQLDLFTEGDLPPTATDGVGSVARTQDAYGLPPSARAAMTLTNFQFGTANSLAKAATDQVIQRPGQISPLVLFGPVGSGKTHLATGLGQHLRRKPGTSSVLQLSAEQFTTRFLQALNGSGLPSLRSQFRDVDILILEDVQFFQGKKATLIELQHTIDSLLRMGKQLILTTDRHPNDLGFLSPEIQNRLVSGLVVPLQMPDREARVAICQRWCEQWRVGLAPGMVEWLADHVAGDTRRLSGALFRLLATQSSRGSLVQPNAAMEVLSDYAVTSGQLCSLSMIQKAVCGLCGIEPADLNGSQRTRKISGARMLAMYLARKHTPAALAEIGEFFGGRRHSTVVAAEKRIRSAVQKNENLETASRPLNLREAIRKVETQLKTG
ncbi:MAG: DnaA/Hda family protein [Pirellulaceae bacterium]|nr:DnaA/Hda family protein [Pirellulaceae bacterium]